ncbi:MAG: hypothetical protein ACQET5_00370 [Halobacteriota archaeon]|uniref:hypothetical protein n=1 Tax=Natronomonas sp. TaxID=2184060 RepID=UPI0039765791
MSENADGSSGREGNPEARTRREMLLTLGGVTVGAAGYGYGIQPSAGDASQWATHDGSTTDRHVEAARAIAEAVYPTSASVDRAFIEDHVFGRTEPRPGHMDGVRSAIETVDGYAVARFGSRISAHPPERRRHVLRSMGVTEAHPNPNGTAAERIRFYLLNDLLFALLTSPVSGDLTGIENPPGYPGGRGAYRRAPDGGESR